MLFWIVAVLLTLAASLAVLLPLAGRSGRYAGSREHEIEVYRDQLAELERDAGRGLIGPAEAQEARAEIGRRILKLAGQADARSPVDTTAKWARLTGAAAVLAVPIVSWAVYSAIGSPDLPGQPLSARSAPSPEDLSIEELIARAETHLVANPDDGQGWEVVAPIYLRLGRYDDAVRAYRNVIRLVGPTAARHASLGEALVSAAGGSVPPAAREAFRAALAIDPTHARARFYLASALAEDGDLEGSQAMLKAMLADAGAADPWRGAVETALADVERRLAAAAAPAAPGPGQAEVEAAQQMSASDRAAMIETMVAGLDERLRENPQDVEGWIRLVRSYMVLDRSEQARDALQRGLVALGAESEAGRRLDAFAASVGVAARE